MAKLSSMATDSRVPAISIGIGDLNPDCPHPAFGMGVRCGTVRRDRHGLDPCRVKHSVERLGELPGSVKLKDPVPQLRRAMQCAMSAQPRGS
jgi:hypothetical protein